MRRNEEYRFGGVGQRSVVRMPECAGGKTKQKARPGRGLHSTLITSWNLVEK